MRILGRFFSIRALPLLAACLLAAVVQADPLSVMGTTTGTFSQGGTNYGSSISGLSFTGSSFGPTTATTLDLGSFTLIAPTSLTNYALDFRLAVNFIVPAGTTGNGVTGTVTGSALWGVGGVTIMFPSTPTTFVFSSPSGSGSFNLTVQNTLVADTTLNSGQGINVPGVSSPVTLYGSISNATISNATYSGAPETASFVLVGSLFAAVAFLLRKRIAV